MKLSRLALFAALSLSACGGDEKSASPAANVAFLHEAAVLGQIDVLVDEEATLTLDRGELSETVELPLGAHKVAIRNVGAATNIDEADLELVEAPYLVVVSGSGAADMPSLWSVTPTATPELSDAESAVGALNLDPGAFSYDVWVGETRVASALANDRKASSAQKVIAGPQSLKIFNAGDDPATARAVFSRSVDFGAQSTVLLVIRVVDGALDVVTVNQG